MHAFQRVFESVGWRIGRYVVLWLVATFVLVAGLIAVLGGDDHAGGLVGQASRAGCVLRRDEGSPPPLAQDVQRPPTFGPSTIAAEPGIYLRSPSSAALVGALRQGIVVLQYQPRLDPAEIQALQREARESPDKVILTPDRSGMPYLVAATAWRRLLGCPRLDGEVLRAVHAFVGRYEGTPRL
jgi:hypothetical protein